MRLPDNIKLLTNLNSKLILKTIYGILFILILITAYTTHLKLNSDQETTLIDFDTFYLIGWLFWQGQINEAYTALTLSEHIQAYYSSSDLMPWTYPPQFTLLTTTFALLPPVLAYLLFATSTLVIYGLVLRRLAGEWFCICIVMLFPAVIINLRIGQNAFLTGTLIGLFVIGMLARRSWAGLPAGLLIIKPHLAVGLAFLTLIQRDWKIIILALIMIIVSSLITTQILGIEIWSSFLNATREAKIFLINGFYPLHRMVSVYAAAHSFGMPANIAFSLQVITALIILFFIIIGYRHNLTPKHLLALVVISPIYISPYLYDYDLVLLGVAFALVMPELTRHGTAREITLFLVLSWVSLGWGVIAGQVANVYELPLEELKSISTFGLTAMLFLSIRILRRSYHTN